MNGYSRRDFLKTGIAAGTLASVGAPLLQAEKQTAFSKVTLGKSGLEVTRLAFGTGTNNGYVQAQLGQKVFSDLVAHAYERGIRFFETAESYVTPAMLGEALKPYPRDSYVLMSKVTTDHADPAPRFDDMLRTSQTEYFDIMLLHWQHTGDWVGATKRWQDGVDQFQAKKAILSRGASVHGLPALRQMPGNPWLQVAMVRMNHNGTRMDGPDGLDDTKHAQNVAEVVDHVHQVKKDGMGVISMKLCGNGLFTEHSDRVEAMRFAFQNAHVDAVTVGFKTRLEIDEAIDNISLALS